MSGPLESLLRHKNLATASFDSHFVIHQFDRRFAGILKCLGQSAEGADLIALFPEFFGNEHYIQEIATKKNQHLHLEHVNRYDPAGDQVIIDLLVVPDDAPNRAILVVEDVTERARAIQQQNQQKYDLYLYRTDAGFRRRFVSGSILGESDEIQQVRRTVERLSRAPSATVLLMGETGTGKNLAARVIHLSSMPADAPFVEINCAALPEHLIESELFGYEKGAFTHATSCRTGLLEDAHGGTLFLDEIAELPLNLQAKLLSVLEAKKFRRLGSNRVIQLNVRIIAATNRVLDEEVRLKRFREDLYYRLNVVTLTLPPLRQLRQDILTIAEHLLRFFNIEFKKQVKGFTPEARQILLTHSWPGNVRELSNCLERAMIFAEKDRIDANDLVITKRPPALDFLPWEVPPNGIDLEDVERRLIRSALQLAGNNKSKAARLLGLTRDTLRYRLEKYGLP